MIIGIILINYDKIGVAQTQQIDKTSEDNSSKKNMTELSIINNADVITENKEEINELPKQELNEESKKEFMEESNDKINKELNNDKDDEKLEEIKQKNDCEVNERIKVENQVIADNNDKINILENKDEIVIIDPNSSDSSMLSDSCSKDDLQNVKNENNFS